MTPLFISDLHLDPARPAELELFIDFAEREGRGADALYILGDLFEAYIGDDDADPAVARVVEALSTLSSAGVRCFIMHGNRDFLIGPAFTERTGCSLLGDYEVIDVHGTRVLLTHGDLLCTDDTAYQGLRATVRNPDWQRGFLAKPVAERRAIANEMRAKSRTEIAAKSEDIMDVNADAVIETMRRFGVRHLLHGHTHRPGVHTLEIDGEAATRIVLGDWHDTGSFVRWTADGFTLERYSG